MRAQAFGFAVVLLAACGDADSVAEVGSSDSFAAEEEVASTGDALLSNAATVWLPMAEGNTWTLASAAGNTKTVTFSDVGGGIGWLDGLSRNGEWTGLASSAPNTLYAWDYDTAQWNPLYRFGYAYTSWSIGAGCDKFTLKRVTTDATVVTEAGTFTGARTISYTMNPPITARCVVPLLESVTFAPGVGVIALVAGGGEKFTLKSAKVGTKRYPLTTGTVTSRLTLDKVAYVNKSNTIQCITTPCPGNAVNAVAKFTYTITNGTSSTQTWQFSSGCQYDLTLTNSAGKVVRQLSDGRFCTLSLTSISLAAGATKTITGSLELIDSEGLQLSGALTAKAFLAPRSGVVSGPVAAASANLSVTVQPAIP